MVSVIKSSRSYIMNPLFGQDWWILASLNNDDGDRNGNEKEKKSKRFRLAKQQLCACITLFCTFLCRRCTTKTWKCLISRFFDDVNSRRLFSLTSFRSKQLQKKGPWPMSSDLDFTFGQKLLFIFFPSSSSLPFFSFWQRCLNSGWVFWICWACTSSWAVG